MKEKIVLEHILQHLTVSAARKKTFALRATKEGFDRMAHLFRAMAASEAAQRRRVLFLLHGPVADSRKNFTEVSAGQLPELREMYLALQHEAEADENVSLTHLARQEVQVGRKSAVLLKKTEEGTAADSYFVCSFCGYIHEGEAPERCPVCQAPRRRFARID